MTDLVTNVVRGSNAERLLLLVHGYGADERDLGGLLSYLDPEGHFAVVLPRAPHAAPGTPGFAWFPISTDGMDPEAFSASLDQLDALVDEQCAELGFARDQAVFGGFSQGAGLALTLAIRAGATTRPAGVLAMSPFAPAVEGLDVDWDAAASIPVLLQHGTEDPMIPVAVTRHLTEELSAHEVPLVYSEYPMGHQVALESVEQARAWLDQVRAGEKPTAPLPAPPPEGPVKAVTTATWEAEVLRSDLPVIVDFWAPWCVPCKQVGPIVEQIALMREGSYKVVKIDIDQEPALAQQYEVQSIPLIALFRDGRLERRSLGAKPRPQLEAELGLLVIP
ncbi:MAG: thioredoxin [Actinobacteria bacterium]|nr:thioredoxin [Actinomycetota bacterium]